MMGTYKVINFLDTSQKCSIEIVNKKLTKAILIEYIV